MRKLVLAIMLVAGVVAAPRLAQAYPQWQFSSGTARCNQCHFAPAGGGLINGYGRDQSGEDLSTWDGNGGFLFGLYEPPKWLALGYDGRGAFTSSDVGEARGAHRAVFPMQADLMVRVAMGESWSLGVTGGFRGQVRAVSSNVGSNNPKPTAVDRLISREHYLMWRPAAIGPYVRAGRFFAPYGLRLAEHILYVRRDLGFGLLEESYNVSGGIVKNEWEFHVTAFGPDFLRQMGGRDAGLAGMFEKKLGDASALGLQTRIGVVDKTQKYAFGGFGKTYFEKAKTLLQAEVNVIPAKFGTTNSTGVAGYLGATVLPIKGIMVGPFVERRQTDIKVKGTGTNAWGAQLNWFPYPHLELVVMGRFQTPAAENPVTSSGAAAASDPGGSMLLVFMHLYL